MKRIFLACLMAWMSASPLHAGQSTITEAEGYACMGYDKSRKVTEEEALTNAKRAAAEYASTYIKSETQVKNAVLEKDLIEAYARATLKVIQELAREWYKDASSGECFKIKIKAEVIPDARAMARVGQAGEDPSAPLSVRVWTEKKEYRQKEKIRIYMRGNKPFHARVLYRDAQGTVLQLLPNPFRAENYFNGGTVYEIPSGNDRFELEVSPPFGEERVIVYASSSPLGDLNLKETGGVYQVQTAERDLGGKTRGVKLQAVKEKKDGKEIAASDFFEGQIAVRTLK